MTSCFMSLKNQENRKYELVKVPDVGALSLELALQGSSGAPLGHLGQSLGCNAAIIPNSGNKKCTI